MTERDAEEISDACSLGIAKLADKFGVKPVPPPQFWIELRYLIRDEVRNYQPVG